jgi:hypothetical protein
MTQQELYVAYEKWWTTMPVWYKIYSRVFHYINLFIYKLTGKFVLFDPRKYVEGNNDQAGK